MTVQFRILQGMFIKRHRIEKGDGGGPLKPADFVIGSAVKIYGRVMTVVDADPFTRSHMASLGIQLAAALPYPVDPTEEYRAAFARKTTGAVSHPRAHPRPLLTPLVHSRTWCVLLWSYCSHIAPRL